MEGLVWIALTVIAGAIAKVVYQVHRNKEPHSSPFMSCIVATSGAFVAVILGCSILGCLGIASVTLLEQIFNVTQLSGSLFALFFLLAWKIRKMRDYRAVKKNCFYDEDSRNFICSLTTADTDYELKRVQTVLSNDLHFNANCRYIADIKAIICDDLIANTDY